MNQVKLSDRVRPNSEVADWVHTEVLAMENTIAEQAREIERLKRDNNRWQGLAKHSATELSALKAQHEQDAQTIKVLQAMARQLKAQPSWVVLPDRASDEITDPAGYDEGWNACLDEVARLNSSPVSDGVVDERAAFEVWAVENHFGTRRPFANSNNYESGYTDFCWKAWQARAALSAPSHGEQARDGWAVSLMGPDEVVRIQRKDGKWCGVTHLSESPRDRLLYEFLRTIAAPSAGSQGGDV